MNNINKKHYRTFLGALIVCTIAFTALFWYEDVYKKIPKSFNVTSKEDIELKDKIFLNAEIEQNVSAGAVPINNSNYVANRNISNNYISELESNGDYKITYKLFGLIDVKSVDVHVVEPQDIIPCGVPIGLYLQTNGVMVIGTGKFTNISGNETEPSIGIVRSGDYITSINSIEVSSKSQLAFLIDKYGQDDIVIGLERNGENIEVKICPEESAPNDYCLGIWVRDDTQGIGTLTYIDSKNGFGALGHGISDVDTGLLLNSNGGRLYETDVWGIKKGQPGEPGGLCGSINYEDEYIIGEINTNTNQGIFGVANDRLMEKCDYETMSIGFKQEIETGIAYVQCDIGDGLERYEISIDKINISDKDLNRGLVLTVTDKRLLNKTNGIVQGMSGSPIVQNEKIIGAVTHVFVKDSTKGYGIFIENMLYTANN